MSIRGIGQTLRLFGPLIQVISLAVLFLRPAGPSARMVCYAGVFVGFVLVVCGNVLCRFPSRETPPAKDSTLERLDP